MHTFDDKTISRPYNSPYITARTQWIVGFQDKQNVLTTLLSGLSAYKSTKSRKMELESVRNCLWHPVADLGHTGTRHIFYLANCIVLIGLIGFLVVVPYPLLYM